jgi:hypothetical protein
MSDYGMIVQTLTIKPDMEDASSDEVSKEMSVGLGQLLHKVTTGLKNLPNTKDAELLSHNITRVGSHLIVSFLFRHS